MKQTLWSSTIQGILSLDLSRGLRFHDDRKDGLLRLLGLSLGMTVVDIGCGPGALTRKLAAWLGPTSQLIGIDRDIPFLACARQKAQERGLRNLRFCEGDALALPFAAQAVDAQHVVRTYWVGVDGLPRLFQELGFTEIQVDAITLPVVPDDARHSREHKRAMVEADRQEALEWLGMGVRLLPEPLPQAHADELRQLIQHRFAERVAMLEQNRAIWDYRIFIVLIVRGTV